MKYENAERAKVLIEEIKQLELVITKINHPHAPITITIGGEDFSYELDQEETERIKGLYVKSRTDRFYLIMDVDLKELDKL